MFFSFFNAVHATEWHAVLCFHYHTHLFLQEQTCNTAYYVIPYISTRSFNIQ